MNSQDISLYDPSENAWWHGEFAPLAELDGGAVFGHFRARSDLPLLAVVYYPDEDLAFTVTDWQGVQPETPNDIPLFTWRCGAVNALLFAGRPVLPPWADWEQPPTGIAAQFATLSLDAQQFIVIVFNKLAGLDAEQRRTVLDALIAAMESSLRK